MRKKRNGLTPEEQDKRDLRILYEYRTGQGTQAEIGRRHGVGQTHVSNLVQGRAGFGRSTTEDMRARDAAIEELVKLVHSLRDEIARGLDPLPGVADLDRLPEHLEVTAARARRGLSRSESNILFKGDGPVVIKTLQEVLERAPMRGAGERANRMTAMLAWFLGELLQDSPVSNTA